MKPFFRSSALAALALLALSMSGQEATAIAPQPSRPAPRDALGPVPTITPVPIPKPQPQLSPVFFPPQALVLDAELPPAPAVRDPIWSELIPHTNELFYAPLGTRLAEGDLSRRMRPRLEAYVAARSAALAELRAALATEGKVSALAAEKDGALAALARQADELRLELQRGGFMVADGNWNRYRNWRLGDTDSKRTPQELLHDEFSVLRAAVFYQEGLSIDQRHLLREVVIELADALGERDQPTAVSFEPEQVVFFLPHGSRFRLPAGLPPDLESGFAQFTAEKAALRRELRDALYELDQANSNKREKQLRELAEKQAPRFAALEVQAERLRAQLAALPDPSTAQAGPATLPSELAQRIDKYLREKATVQQAARQHAQPGAAPLSRAALVEFEQQNRARLAALATEARAIRDAVARHAATIPGGAAPKTVDSLLADFSASFQRQQLRKLYDDYRTAVLRPGLSVRQRQLLFDAALAALDQTGLKDWQAVPE